MTDSEDLPTVNAHQHFWDVTVGSNRDVVLRAVDLFGVDRAMFASNFPVDSLAPLPGLDRPPTDVVG